MNCYIISYNLNKPGRNYEELYKLIKSYYDWAHITESTWIVYTSTTAVEIRDKLKIIVDSNDSIFIARVGTPTAWTDLGNNVSEWLKNIYRLVIVFTKNSFIGDTFKIRDLINNK